MSLTSDDLADIKQLMEALFRAHGADFERRFDSLDERVSALEKEMNQQFREVDQRFKEVDQQFKAVHRRFDELRVQLDEAMVAIGANQEGQSEQLDDHEQRITLLERQVA